MMSRMPIIGACLIIAGLACVWIEVYVRVPIALIGVFLAAVGGTLMYKGRQEGKS